MSLAKRDRARGERLQALREAKKLTQPQASARLGVEMSTLSRWERGFPIKPKNLDKLSEFYGVEQNYIVEGTDDDAAVETYPAFREYKDWLDKHPEELAALPEGGLEAIRTYRIRLPGEYEPNLNSYMTLHTFMVGLKRKKRGRS